MKKITKANKLMALVSTLILSTAGFASGTMIGNGFTAQSIVKDASLLKSKTNEKLCTDVPDAKLSKVGADDVCALKDGSTVKLKDLVEAAQKNDKTAAPAPAPAPKK